VHKKFIDGDVEGSVLLGLLGRSPPESAPCGSLTATLTLREGSGPIVNIVCRNISCLEELLDLGGSPSGDFLQAALAPQPASGNRRGRRHPCPDPVTGTWTPDLRPYRLTQAALEPWRRHP